MTIEIHPATPSDAPALAEVFLSTFSDNFNVALFPRTQDVRDWWISKFTSDITSCTSSPPLNIVLKAIDTSSQNGDGEATIAGFANWKLPGNEDTDEEAVSWPESCIPELCERFFGVMKEKRDKYMGAKRHYYLDILGTHPAYRGRGIASQLLQWGISRADQEGVDIFLSSSPQGRHLYDKYEFRVLETEKIFPDYVQSYLVRAPGQ